MTTGGQASDSSKLSRHWREVLSSDLKSRFGGDSPKKSGKGSIKPDQRMAIWIAVIEQADKADWNKVEKETGVSGTKLRRHLRESMRKEGERMIGT